MKVRTILKHIEKLERELYEYSDNEIWQELSSMEGSVLLDCIAEGLLIDEK